MVRHEGRPFGRVPRADVLCLFLDRLRPQSAAIKCNQIEGDERAFVLGAVSKSSHARAGGSAPGNTGSPMDCVSLKRKAPP
jgi:hypothetical protein